MRQRIAMAVSATGLGVLVLLSVVFARAQNPPAGADVTAVAVADSGPDGGAPRVAPDATAQAADTARGRAVFAARCAGCHSARGVGSPRLPLDGVGTRRGPASLRAWTLGADVLADSLSPSALRAKRAFRTLPPADLDAVVAYLATLREDA